MISSQSILTCLLLVVLINSSPIFLFGGPLTTSSSPIYQEIIKATRRKPDANCDQNWISTSCPRVAVVTSGSVDASQGNQEYNQGQGQIIALSSLFSGLGTVPRHVSVHVDNYMSTANWMSQEGMRNSLILQAADVIFFNGGSQARHMLCWFNLNNQPNQIFSALRRRVATNQVVVMAVSEGASMLGALTYGSGSSFGHLYFSNSVGLARVPTTAGYLEDRRSGNQSLQFKENGAFIQGFSFITQFLIDCNFNSEGKIGRLIPDMNNLKYQLGVGLDRDAAIHYEKGVGTVYGSQGVTIVDLKQSIKVPSTFLQIKNGHLHYLTSGDSFDFINRRFMTSKPRITTPSENSFADSEDILGKDQAARLITRLVNQRAIANEGQTVVPPNYPTATSKFSVLFYKGEDTQGYQAQTSISAFDVHFDLSPETRS